MASTEDTMLADEEEVCPQVTEVLRDCTAQSLCRTAGNLLARLYDLVLRPSLPSQDQVDDL